MVQRGGAVPATRGRAGVDAAQGLTGPLPGVVPEVAAVDPDEAGLNAVLVRVVPGAVRGQADTVEAQRVNVGPHPGANIVLQDHAALLAVGDEQAVVLGTYVPAR